MTKLTPKKFITLYVKAKLKGFHTVLDICRYMNVRSKTTFYKFWNDPDIKNKIELKLNQSPKEFSLVQSDPSLARDIDRAQEVLDKNYELFQKGIRKAEKEEDWDKARQLAIKALQIVRSESDYKRIILMVGGDVIQNLTINQIQNHPQYVNMHSQAMNNDWSKDLGLLCDKCRERITRKYSTRKYSDDVIDIEGTDEP